ncbi:MAG: alanine/glycine:cation symporter family protein [Cyanobacteria bacterium J06641_5]
MQNFARRTIACSASLLVLALFVTLGVGHSLEAELLAWGDRLGKLLAAIASIVLWEVQGVPLLILWIFGGSAYLTLRLGFINLRGFRHALEILRGSPVLKATANAPANTAANAKVAGEVSHFQALATALSATVGLGNVAGVAIAVSIGGPGAALWMSVAGFFGMTSKFVECTLAQKYRQENSDGTAAGGPMYYIPHGLARLGLPRLGQVLAGAFAVLVAFSSMASSSIFQSNQSFQAIAAVLPPLQATPWLYGLLLATLVGAVIFGGIRRIASVATAIVPLMCGVYVLAALWVLGSRATEVPAAFATIVASAISPTAVGGGVVGAFVQGLRRAAFSNEAGLGTAAIAHAATRTKEPIQAGYVALLEPFIDTVCICNLTALVLVVTDAYQWETLSGAAMTAAAFGSVLPWFPPVLAVALFCFAFSTIVSCSYYGEMGWCYLFGKRSSSLYKAIFLLSAFLGAIVDPGAVIDFSDAMLLTLSLPNLGAIYFLLAIGS